MTQNVKRVNQGYANIRPKAERVSFFSPIFSFSDF